VTVERESLANPRLWLAFASMLLVSGIANTFPVLLPSLLAEFGASRGATALPVSLAWLGGAALGPLAGYLIARGDPRLLVSAGLVAAAAGTGLGARAVRLWDFSVPLAVGMGIGVGFTGLATQAALLGGVYVRRRGLAMGIAFSGAMAAYGLAPLVQWTITHLGWRTALAGQAAAILALVPVAWLVYPRRLDVPRAPACPEDARSVGAIVASLPFWSLMVVFSVPPLIGYLATTQHALYFPARGFTTAEASVMLAVGGVLSTSGRALAGLLADRLGGPTAGFASYGMTLTGLACLLAMEWAPARALAWGYVLFIFLPLGSRATIVSVLISRICAPAQFGVVFGLLGIGNSLFAAAGPAASGWIYDVSGSYLAIYACAAALAALGLSALAVFVATSRAPRAR
jgi:predicted MFS family arabinose efflux permease